MTKGKTMATIAPADRRLPWDVMGDNLTEFSTQPTTAADALAQRGMDYTVEVRDLFSGRRIDDLEGAADNAPGVTHDRFLQAPGLRTIVRPMPDGTEKVLSAVGTRFTPIQNVDAFSVADLLVAEFGSRISGAADYRSGGASLLAVDLQRPVRLDLPGGGEQDVTDLHLVMKNAQDGSGALTFALTGVRFACTNALQAAIKGAQRTWKISHTPSAQERVNLAHQSIIRAMAYQDAFQAQAQAMLDTAMLDAEFDKIVAGMWHVQPGKEETKAGQRALAIRQEVQDLYRTSETLDGVRGTIWGGYNALTEWYDWERPVRNGDASRAEGALDGEYVRRKASVWETFAAAV